jgi:hypothetical protein
MLWRTIHHIQTVGKVQKQICRENFHLKAKQEKLADKHNNNNIYNIIILYYYIILYNNIIIGLEKKILYLQYVSELTNDLRVV